MESVRAFARCRLESSLRDFRCLGGKEPIQGSPAGPGSLVGNLLVIDPRKLLNGHSTDCSPFLNPNLQSLLSLNSKR